MSEAGSQGQDVKVKKWKKAGPGYKFLCIVSWFDFVMDIYSKKLIIRNGFY
jgi:hypothetical protein